jgi:hypothetical protein
VAIAFGTVFILAPLARVATTGVRNSATTLIYFGLIGLGYIIVEVVLLVKFTLFLGHPTRSLTVTLFALLIFSGTGAFLARYVKTRGSHQHLMLPAAGIAGLGAIYTFALPAVLSSAMGLPLWERIGVTVALTAPLGMMMGMPLPLGIAVLRTREPRLIIWAWGVNGFCSVIGSVLAIVFAQAFGYRATLLIGLSLYVAAILSVRQLTDSRRVLHVQ